MAVMTKMIKKALDMGKIEKESAEKMLLIAFT